MKQGSQGLLGSPGALGSAAFARLGIDFEQWKALTAATLKLDVRGMRGANGARYGPFAANVGLQFILYSGLGAVVAALVWLSRDVWIVTTIGTAYTMMLVGMMVFIDHNSIVSPVDHAVLAHHPINSRTYFAARVANALVYTMATTAALVWLPIASFLIRYGPELALAAGLAFFASAIAVTLAILVAYAAVVRTFGAERIRRALSYAQLGMSFLVYGGLIMGTRRLAGVVAARNTASELRWLLLLPPAWFASYVSLARGAAGRLQIIAALASVGVLVALARALAGRLTLEYSQHVAETIARSECTDAGRERGSAVFGLFRAGEARAVAVLVRSQFQNDLKFRLAVLAVLPLTLFYAWYGADSGAIHDPFVQAQRAPDYPLVLVAILMFPATLRTQLTGSDAFRASWIFFATPCDRIRIVESAKNVVLVLFLLPYLLFVAALFIYMTGTVWHVLVHLTLIGLVSHLGLQVLVLMDPALPFSRPLAKGQNPRLLFVFMMASSIAAMLLQILSPFLYSSAVATTIVFALVIGASVVVDRATRARVAHQTAQQEFSG